MKLEPCPSCGSARSQFHWFLFWLFWRCRDCGVRWPDQDRSAGLQSRLGVEPTAAEHERALILSAMTEKNWRSK